MSLQDFISKYSGQFIDFDGVYGAQCVDEINQYLVDCLGISNPISVLSGDTAFDIYSNYSGSEFDKIANTPEGVPQEGDIVFWNTTVGSAGHVAIFISGDANSFTSLDQNWPTGSSVHQQYHSYNGVCGWLHPKTNPPVSTINSMPEVITNPQQKIHIGVNPKNSRDFGDQELQAVQSIIFDEDNKIDSLAAQVSVFQNTQSSPKTAPNTASSSGQTITSISNSSGVSTINVPSVFVPTTSYKFAPWVPQFIRDLLAG